MPSFASILCKIISLSTSPHSFNSLRSPSIALGACLNSGLILSLRGYYTLSKSYFLVNKITVSNNPSNFLSYYGFSSSFLTSSTIFVNNSLAEISEVVNIAYEWSKIFIDLSSNFNNSYPSTKTSPYYLPCASPKLKLVTSFDIKHS